METKQFTRRSFIGATGAVALAGMGMGSMRRSPMRPTPWPSFVAIPRLQLPRSPR